LPIKLIKISRETKYKGYDYILENLKNFEKIEPYVMYPKLDGKHWRVALADISIKEAREVLERTYDSFSEIDIYLKDDALQQLNKERRRDAPKEKTSWEKYLERLADFPLLIEHRTSSELFRRCRGNMEMLEDLLVELQSTFFDVGTIQMTHLNQVSVKEDRVYSRDVILTLLLHDNEHVPLKGSRLSLYKYKKWETLLVKLQHEIGEKIAFLAMRKYVAKLYENKIKYLENKLAIDHKDVEILRVIDVYEILHTHTVFQISNNMQAEAVLYAINERRKEHNVNVIY